MSSRRPRDVLPSSIIPTLQSYPQLSTLYSYINGSSKLFNLLNSSTGFTFLAPTNDAFSQWISSQGNSTPPTDVIDATLSYHLLTGNWLTVDFSIKPQFASSSLTNVSYSNVTISPAGQRVEIVSGAGGDPEFLSNNKTVTTIATSTTTATRDIVCLNGLIQIVNSILSIPTSLVLLTAQANMSFFIAILNRANFLSVDDSGLIDFVNYASFTPNMTFFIPNSAAALSTFTNISTGISADNLTALFDYHIVPNHVLYSPDLVNGTVLPTTQGDSLTITTQGSDIYVNSAKIITSDYLIVNGVIHTIDSVLDRFNPTIPAQPSNTTSTPPPSTSSPSQSGLSTSAKIGIGVAIPIAFIAIVIALTFWFLKRKKASKQQSNSELDANERTLRELGADPAAKELNANHPAAKELHTNDSVAGELHGVSRPQELPSPHNLDTPAELE